MKRSPPLFGGGPSRLVPSRSGSARHRPGPGRFAFALALALALTLACGSEGPGPAGNGMPPVAVQTATAAGLTVPRSVSAVGSLESPDPTTVAAEVAGTLVLLDVPEGQRVSAGHVLARIEDSEFRAAVAADRARFRNTDERLRRVRQLHEQGVASQQALDDAQSEYDEVRASLDSSLTRLRKTTIRAPFDGVLGLRQASQGAYVEPGDPIVTITQIDPLELVFAVPQRYAADVKVGQKVYASAGGCKARFEATVSALDPRMEPSTRMLPVEARVPNPEGRLAPGMAVRARVVIGAMPGSVVVPQEAVVRQGTKHLVFVVDAERAVSTREIALGEVFVDGVQIQGPLKAGEEVVVAGQQKLHPGSIVAAEPRRPTDNPLLDLGWLGPADGCAP